jgi:hexosaminidase
MKKCLLIFAILTAKTGLFATQSLPLIPAPENVTVNEGEFVFGRSAGITARGIDVRTAELFGSFMSANYGLELKKGSGRGSVKLVYDSAAGEESYRMEVTPADIVITGGHAGIFYGLQTLRQLVRNDGGRVTVPCVEISDSPRFEYRGLLLDVARYFYSVEYVKEFIDLMSQFKLNRFHWHLTNDQGWRIEIGKHPGLTGLGAWRSATQLSKDKTDTDRLSHGGFYTRDDIREVVAYAAERFVEIIPEIDMPGHTMSVLALYPEFSCTGGPFTVPEQWGIKPDVLCIGNEDIYAFIADILDEVVELFPCEYLNIGGDEAPTVRWEACTKCQALMKARGMENPRELQNHFTARLNRMVVQRGKKVIGWTEILDGSRDHKVTIMSWQGEEGGIRAAQQHQQAVMSPHLHMYLDYYQAEDQSLEPFNIGHFVSLRTTYEYEPYTPRLTPDLHKYIIGVQGCVWTEYIHSEPMVDYMTWPRALAVAETGWSGSGKKDYADFTRRLPPVLATLDRAGVMFRIPEPFGLDEAVSTDGKVRIELTSPVEGAQIYYTANGLNPTAKGTLYTRPLELPLRYGAHPVKCVVRLPSGRSSAVYTVTPKAKQ